MDAERTWIFSDPHFNHKNIIKYCSRPFSFDAEGVDAMNRSILDSIEAVVPDGSNLICLGDWAMMYSEESWDYIRTVMDELSSGHGYHVYTLLGNHDRGKYHGEPTVKEFSRLPFEGVWEFPTIINDYLILSHEPVMLESNSIYVNLHGHIHDAKLVDCDTYKGGPVNHYVNCCLDANGMKPLSLDVIIKNLSSMDA